jgi:hypothetical protein
LAVNAKALMRIRIKTIFVRMCGSFFARGMKADYTLFRFELQPT